MCIYMCVCVCIYRERERERERGFPSVSVVKNLSAMQEPQEMQVRSLSWEDPSEEGIATHSTILAWRIPMDRGAW